jgi:transposase InsO family protein
LFVHANAALSLRQRQRLIGLVGRGKTISAAARLVGCSRQTASKWVGRHRRGEGLTDRSSRPHRSPRRASASLERAVLKTRRELRAGPHPIGWELGVPISTVHAILRRHGVSRLNPAVREPVIRYERERPGELIHIDVKRLGRIQRPRDPHTGLPHGTKGKAGWDYLFVCVDDKTRLAHAAFYPAETTANALDFLDRCRRFYRRHGIEIEEVLTDNGKCFQRTWKQRCRQSGITPRHTRIRRPQTNGKAERFIQTLLNGWIRPHTYTTNQHRTDALVHYLDYYNHQRRHRALHGLTPAQTVNNLPGTHNQVRFVNLVLEFRTATTVRETREPGSRTAANQVQLGRL